VKNEELLPPKKGQSRGGIRIKPVLLRVKTQLFKRGIDVVPNYHELERRESEECKARRRRLGQREENLGSLEGRPEE